MQIDRFKFENDKYKSQIMRLNGTKHRIQGEVSQISKKVSKLKKNVDILKNDLKKYDQLRRDLEGIAGDNEDLNRMVEQLNGMYTGMKSAVVQNQRSLILEIFYEVQFKDKSDGLSKREYKRFKARLDVETRERFEKFGNLNLVILRDWRVLTMSLIWQSSRICWNKYCLIWKRICSKIVIEIVYNLQ